MGIPFINSITELIGDVLLIASNYDKIVSEPEDHLFEVSELSSDQKATLRTAFIGSKTNQFNKEVILQWKKMIHAPGPTKYASSRIHDELSAFRFFVTKEIEQIVIENRNTEGNPVLGNEWKKKLVSSSPPL